MNGHRLDILKITHLMRPHGVQWWWLLIQKTFKCGKMDNWLLLECGLSPWYDVLYNIFVLLIPLVLSVLTPFAPFHSLANLI